MRTGQSLRDHMLLGAPTPDVHEVEVLDEMPDLQHGDDEDDEEPVRVGINPLVIGAAVAVASLFYGTKREIRPRPAMSLGDMLMVSSRISKLDDDK